MLSDYYVATNRADDALATLARLSPNKAAEVDVKSRTAVIRYTQGQAAEAHAIVDGLLKEHADRAYLRLIKAQFLLRDRRLDEALAQSRRAIEFDSSSAAGFRLLGEIHASRYELTEAAKALTRSLEIGPICRRAASSCSGAGAGPDRCCQGLRAWSWDQSDALTRLLIATALIRTVTCRMPPPNCAPRRQVDSPDVQIALGRLSY
jgi:tetratricopeptide (TPR) repeat protein